MTIFKWITIFAILRVTNSETVDPKEKLRVDLSNIKDRLNGMQGDTDGLTKSLDDFSAGLDEYIKKEDDTDAYNDKLAKAYTVVLGTSMAISKLKSGEAKEIISGVLEMTSMALTTFGGPYGAAATVLVNIVSSLVDLFMTTPTSTPSIEKVMSQALDEFQDQQNLHRMISFASTLTQVHNGIIQARKFSKEIEGRDLTDEQITQLKTEIEYFSTNALLGDVKQGIANEIESGKVPDAKRALKTLNVYCKLNIVVELILVEFTNYIRVEGPETNKMPTIYESYMKTTRKQDEKYLEFLHVPDLKEALVAAIYQHSPQTYPELRDYIKAIKVAPIPELGLKEDSTIYLTPKEWPEWHFYLSGGHNSYVYGSKSINKQSKFILRNALSGERGRVWKMESKYYPEYFISAQKFASCLPIKYPDEVEHVEGLTMDYVYNKGANCRNQCKPKDCMGCYSNCYTYFVAGNTWSKVSINYEWRFTKLKSKGGPAYYFISATQENFGPGYTLFMKDSNNGNAYLKYGNPKEQGMFKLTESG